MLIIVFVLGARKTARLIEGSKPGLATAALSLKRMFTFISGMINHSNVFSTH